MACSAWDPNDVIVRLVGFFPAGTPAYKRALVVNGIDAMLEKVVYSAELRFGTGESRIIVDLRASVPNLYTLVNALANVLVDASPAVLFQVERQVEHGALQRSVWLDPEENTDLDESLKVAAFGPETADVTDEMSWECQLKVILDGGVNELIDWQPVDIPE